MIASRAAGAPPPPYARAWWIVVSFFTVAGSLLAVVTVGGGTVAGMAVTAGLMSACTSLLMRAEDGAATRKRFRTLARDSATGAVAVCAAVGWVGLAGPGMLLLFLAVAVTSPRSIRMISSRLEHERRVATAPAPERIDEGTRSSVDFGLGPGDIASATTRQIVTAWNASGAELQRGRAAGGACLHLVRLRQACLDELERRDPAGLQCWLASGPSVGGDPTRYFGPDLPASGAA